jgi:hypothetical protein
MSILSKTLGALMSVLILFSAAEMALQGATVFHLWTIILSVPIALALFGRGGKAVYVVALLGCWALAGMMLVALPLEIYLDYFSEAATHDGSPVDPGAVVLICLIGMFGIAGHACVSRLHPVASRNILARKLNALFIDTMRRQALALAGNIVLIVMVIEAGWMFREVAIVYWYESVLITLFTIWIVRNQQTFSRRHACFAAPSLGEAKEAFCSEHLGGYFLFYAVYLGIILMVGGLPEWSQLGPIAVIAIAWFLGHYFDASKRHRVVRNKALDLNSIENRHIWRIMPIHLGCMLGILAIGNDDGGLALVFILIKTIAEIVQEAVFYSRRRKQAIYRRRRRPVPPDLGGTTTVIPTRLIPIGNKAH